MYQIATWISAVVVMGRLRTACVQEASGGEIVGTLGLMPVSMTTTSRLPCATPDGSVIICEVTAPDEATLLPWTGAICAEDERLALSVPTPAIVTERTPPAVTS